MIDLTPLEVRKKKGDFRRSMRGYEPALVDDFLDVAADRLEQLVRENMALHEKVAELAAQVTEFRDRERALTEALVSAQGLREDLRRQATREVELAKHAVQEQAKKERVAIETELQQLRASGAQRASDALEDVREVRAREEELLRELRARQQEFLSAYRGFLEDELGELDTIARAAGIALGIALRPADSRSTVEPFEPEEFIEPEASIASDESVEEEEFFALDESIAEGDAPVAAAELTVAERAVDAAPSEHAAPSENAARSEDAASPNAMPSLNGTHAEPVSDETAAIEAEPLATGSRPDQAATNAWAETPEWSTPELELVESADEDDLIELDPVEEDPETTILLRNAAAAGYQLDDDDLPDELLLDDTVTDDVLDEEEDDGWLPSLLDDDK